MTVTVSANLTELYDADAGTWTGVGGTPSTNATVHIEGTGCQGFQLGIEEGYAYITISTANADLSNQRIYSWVRIHQAIDVTTAGGIGIVLGDGTNRIMYYVGGSDDFGFQRGAWTNIMLDTANLPANFSQVQGSTAPTLTAITQVGVGFTSIAKAQGNTDNFFWDVCRFGRGLGITGGVSTDVGLFSEIQADDVTNAYGIIRELQAGVFGLQGDLDWGTSTGPSFYFQDDGVVVVLEDHVHGSGTPTAFTLDVFGSTAVSHYELGLPVSTGDDERGISGVTFINANTANGWTFDASDTDLEDLLLFGCNLNDFTDAVLFSADATNGPTHRISGSNLLGDGPITEGRAVFRNCNIGANLTTAAGAVDWDANTDIERCLFLSNTEAGGQAGAISRATTGTITFQALTFADNDFDFINNSTGLVTINVTSGDTPSIDNVGTGSTTVTVNTVSIQVTVSDSDGVAIEDAQTAIYATDTVGGVSSGDELLSGSGGLDTSSLGVAQNAAFNFEGILTANVRVRKSSPSTQDPDPRYLPFNQNVTINSAGLDFPVTLNIDSIPPL